MSSIETETLEEYKAGLKQAEKDYDNVCKKLEYLNDEAFELEKLIMGLRAKIKELEA